MIQSDKLASIGQLAAGMAHEINNPIGFVNSNLSTLKSYLERLFDLLHAYSTFECSLSTDSEVLAELTRLKSEIELDYLLEDAPMLVNESIDGVARVRKIVQDLKSFSRTDVKLDWPLADLHVCLTTTLNIAHNEIKYKADDVKEFGQLPEVECLPIRRSAS